MNTDIQDILNRLQIDGLNAMQEASLRAAMDKEDMVLLSPTGTGKTLAYLIPLVMQLRTDVSGVQAVVLVPSRELALQTELVFKTMGTPFKAVSCYGGRPAMDEHRAMKSIAPAVIIATPGRMNDHLHKNNINPESVRILVIDEFDKCLEFGFHDEMSEVIRQFPSLKKRILLSATDAPEIPEFAGVRGVVRRLNFLGQNESSDTRLQVFKVISPEKDKLETLYKLLGCLGRTSTLVFCNHRESVERTGKFLKSAHVYCETFHGGMEQDARERALYKFRNGSCSILISTDLAARGLDISGVKNVVHYHLPVSPESFIHRNGRTARWDSEGSAYLILYSQEPVPEYLTADPEEFVLPDCVDRPLPPDFVTLYIGKGKKDKINKTDILGFLSKKGGLNRNEVGKIDVLDHHAFVAIAREKANHTLKMVRNEKIKGIKALIELAK